MIVYFLLIGFSIVTSSCLHSQNIENEPVMILSKNSLDLKLDKIIAKDFYIDSSKELKAVFTLKIDSLGEVHSAHIRWSKNLKSNNFYDINREIEFNLRLPFIFNEYKDEFIGEKYVIGRYPYFSKR